jgi:hypothetical protein
MPLNDRAAKVLREMKARYGDSEGERVFYATANKQGRTPETWSKTAMPSVTARALAKHAESVIFLNTDGTKVSPSYAVGRGATSGAMGGVALGVPLGAVMGSIANYMQPKERRKSFLRALLTGAAVGGVGSAIGGGAAGALTGKQVHDAVWPHTNKENVDQLMDRYDARVRNPYRTIYNSLTGN